MINKKEYTLLKLLSKGNNSENEKYYCEIKNLLEEQMISYNITGETCTSILYDGFLVTALGFRAIEEYENFIDKENREKQTFILSTKADKRSTISLWVSILAALFGLLGVVVSLIGIFKG